MSFLSITSSSHSSTANVEFPELAYAPVDPQIAPNMSDWSGDGALELSDFNISTTSSPVMEHVPPEVRELVCDNCWGTVFTSDAFRQAWETRHSEMSWDPSELDRGGFFYTTPTWTQMQHQNRRHFIRFQHVCHWCEFICQTISQILEGDTTNNEKKFQMQLKFRTETSHWPPPYKHRTYGSRLHLLARFNGTYDEPINPTMTDFVVHATNDDPAARFIDHRPMILDVDSPTAYSLIKKRIDDCLLHELCPKPSYAPLPTRVIDCEDLDHPRLFVSNGIEDHYVALSYVWGAALEDLPHCTTTQNLESYIVEIPLNIIPPTIMDAITVTRKLGLRYLWVDSLCILQDSKEDKGIEISKILNTFRDAYMTIIAACADRVSEGFLRTRIKQEDIISLPFICPNGDIGTMEVRNEFEDLNDTEPTEERAWCLEEWMLSPRKLIYATHTLQYECQAIHVNVNDACGFMMPSVDLEGIPRIPLFTSIAHHGPDDGDQTADSELGQVWKRILQRYSLGFTTKQKDRLIALSGIAKQFQSFWPQRRYMAGIWDHHILNDLLWCYAESVPQVRPDRYRAPSWSWASIDGPIEFIVWPNDGFLYNVIQWDVGVKRQDNPYGEVEGGYLTLDAILQPAVWDAVEGALFDATSMLKDHPDSVGLEFDKDGQWYQNRIPARGPMVWHDALEPVSQVIGKVFLVPGCHNGDCLSGLVLVPVTSQTTAVKQYDHSGYPVYRRVGFFQFPVEGTPETWMKSPRQLLRII
ncbi:heterokaryon incompatibility protein-domain-containing protein [Armillaria novae-zelandiae]|uniref:Heterokaryon incompatibility protein-domain-containing protein n=1 Tax=Armillaria novae-zelandiae TaxID=153914 RepID=A0AA39T9W8_9AGAR|nr:heterokaryon incompatibility protein-domain-containing protein [Armillaria novae-zelandiae]